ncbi:DUF2726 domain-containing protein [Ligaoa zhengdingensis]|uniref:DUF2726 domain-containing protein n=1 Tax=Ligaoa zhengdingensis TaxID=2763658 RepID=UPI0031CCAC78
MLKIFSIPLSRKQKRKQGINLVFRKKRRSKIESTKIIILLGFLVVGLIFILVIIGAIILSKRPPQRPIKNIETNTEIQDITEQTKPELEIEKAYKSKWLFTYNEKAEFKKIKEITDKYGLYVFAKVRLLDLIEPIRNNPKYKTYFYKIQAKHVDFVICSPSLVAKIIIEIDDNSHKQAARQERDQFVNTALKAAGYKTLRYYSIDVPQLEKIIIKTFNIDLATTKQ